MNPYGDGTAGEQIVEICMSDPECGLTASEMRGYNL